jgi:hypothetical protein
VLGETVPLYLQSIWGKVGGFFTLTLELPAYYNEKVLELMAGNNVLIIPCCRNIHGFQKAFIITQ